MATADDFATISFFLDVKFVSILGCTLYLDFFVLRCNLGLVDILLVTLAVSDSSSTISGGAGGCECKS